MRRLSRKGASVPDEGLTAEPAAAAYAIGETLWSSVGHPQRGTPELSPVRVHYESTVRSLLGDERYETVLLQSAGRGPDAALAELLGPAAQE